MPLDTGGVTQNVFMSANVDMGDAVDHAGVDIDGAPNIGAALRSTRLGLGRTLQDVSDATRKEFPAFYATLFDQTLANHPRSAANMYCMRSLVPTETKSVMESRASRCQTSDGASIIAPTRSRLGSGRPRRSAQATSSSTRARAARNSSTLAMSGNMILRSRPRAAEISARS